LCSYLQDPLNAHAGLPFVPNDLVDLIAAYAAEPPKQEMGAALINFFANFQEHEMVTRARTQTGARLQMLSHSVERGLRTSMD